MLNHLFLKIYKHIKQCNHSMTNILGNRDFWMKLLTVLGTIIGFFLIQTFYSLQRAIDKLDNVTNESNIIKQKVEFIELRLDNLDRRIYELETGQHPSTSNRYKKEDALKEHEDLREWVDDRYVRKPD
jgi:hypothetical protein